MFDWSQIDAVFMDMDGTLLDLHFDNHFWLEHVPRRFAEAKGITVPAAKNELLPRYRDIEGTLDWYCIDHWSRELGLDIALLKQEVEHLIQVHPYVLEFLEALASHGKSRVLVTNAHQKALALKMEKTQLAGHFERIVCAHELGLPKEDRAFWARLHAILPFDRERTLFVDDSVAVLRSAAHYGFKHLLAIINPDSQQPLKEVTGYPSVPDFSSLFTGLRGHETPPN